MKTAVMLRIDDPEDRVIRVPVCIIRGWCAGHDQTAVQRVQFRIGPRNLSWRVEHRPDVTAAHPDIATVGFCIDFDLREHLYSVEGSLLTITAVIKGAPEIELKFSLANGVIGNCLAAAASV